MAKVVLRAPAAVPDRVARVCAVAALAATGLLGAWLLLVPDGFDAVRPLNPRAVWELRARVGLASPRVSVAAFATGFRVLTLLAFGAYAGLWAAVLRGARLGARWTWPLAVPTVAWLAVATPASLSTDVFAYVGYARMAVAHGLNPYLHTQAELARLGDPTAGYLRWPIASPYGPLWTLISIAVVWAAPAGSVLGAAIALKLVAGAALIGAALAARALGAAADSERGNATFVLVTTNPLLLVEGPGMGHNDLVMMALVMLAFALLARRRRWPAALAMGAAAAVKLVPVVAVPWLMISSARAAAAGWRARLGAAALVGGLALLPVVASYAPFWSGLRTLDGLAARWRRLEPAALEPGLSIAAPPRSTTNAELQSGLARAGTLERATRFARELAIRCWPVLLVYAAALLALARGDPGDFARATMTAWSLVGLAIVLFAAGLWFPWYLAWLWPPLAARPARRLFPVGVFVFLFSVALQLAYVMPLG